MPRFSGKKTDVGVPVTIDGDRYTEGDIVASMEGGVVLGEKPGNVCFPIQIDASGYLQVAIGGGITPGTEYSDGDASGASKGTLIMGDDGAGALQNISVDANGRLQVEVVQGEYDGVQYQDGAAVAAPFGYVTLGHDGSNVFPVVVDGSGYLQVDVRNLPADTFAAEGDALGKGVLLQGDDGTDRKNIAVNPTTGNVQMDVIASLPIGSNAIGKLAANSGVDIGDVDVKSIPKATTLDSVADVSLIAGATTQIVGGLASRLCVFITNKKSNTQTFRIGDSNANVSRGIELAPGASIGIETTEAIHGYNPGGGNESVSVIWTAD